MLASVIALVLFLVAYKSASAAVGINHQINFQGKIVNNSGSTNIADGTYNMEFKIYSGGDGVVGGGDESLLWTESRLRNNSQGVTITNGIFQVNLGSITSLPGSIDFNSDTIWLSINLGNTNATCTPFSSCSGDGEMSPMVRFTAAPYAFNSDKLGGLDKTAFGQLASNQTWTGTNTFQPTTNIPSTVIKQTSVGSPTADILNVQTANGTNIIQVTGPAANEAAVTIKSIGATRALTLESGSGTVSLGASTILTANGALTLSSGGSSGLTLDSASGRLTVATGDFLKTSIAGVTGAAAGDIWYDSAAGKYKINEGGTTKTLCNLTDTACGSGGSISLPTAYTNGSAGDQIISLTTANDSIIVRNPSGSGTDSAFVMNIDQLNVAGPADTLLVSSAGTGNLLSLKGTSATPVLKVTANGNTILAPVANSATLFNVQNAAATMNIFNIDSIGPAGGTQGSFYGLDNTIDNPGNLLESPGFEEGNNKAWATTTGVQTNSSNAHSGNKYLEVQGNGASNQDVVEGKWHRVEPGQVLYYEGYVKTTTAAAGTGGFYIECRDKDLSASSFSSGDTWTAPGTTYTLRTNTYTVPASRYYCRLSTTVRSDNSLFWWYDDLYLAQVTQRSPLTIANSANSATALQVKDAAANSLLAVDTTGTTTNGILTVNTQTGGTTYGIVANRANAAATFNGFALASLGVPKQIFQMASNDNATLYLIDNSDTIGGAVNRFQLSPGYSQFWSDDINFTTNGNGPSAIALLELLASGNTSYQNLSISSGKTLTVVNGATSLTNSTGNALTVSNSTGTGNIALFKDNTTAVLTVADGGLITMAPAASLTNGQIHVIQNITSANTTASGTVRGYQMNFTVDPATSTATTHKGFEINLTDNDVTTSHTDIGLQVNMSGSNTTMSQLGVDSSLSKGVAIRGVTTGAASAVFSCGSNFAWSSIGVCGAASGSGVGVGVMGVAQGSGATGAPAGSGVFGANETAGTAAETYKGIQGYSVQTNAAAYTSYGVHGYAGGGAGATVYSGYFTLISSNTASLGAVLQSQGVTPALVSSGNGSSAIDTLVVSGGNGGNVNTATGTVTGGTGADVSLTAGNGGTASGAATTNNGGVAGAITITAGNGGATSGATTNNGAAGGAVTLQGGAGGNGTTANGAGGGLALQGGTGGVAAGTRAAGGNITIFGGDASTSGSGIANGGTVTVDAGNKASTGTSTLNLGDTRATAINIGGTTNATNISVAIATTGVINIGDVANTHTINIGGVNNSGTDTVNIATNATAADSLNFGSTNASSTLTLEAGLGSSALQIGNGATAHGIQIGTGAAVQTIVIGSTNSTSKLTLNGGNISTTNNLGGVVIGSGFSQSDTSLTPLTLDSTITFTETASTCTTSVNGGALYYNSAQSSGTQGGSTAIRACINGNWEDMVSTAALGIMLFGVVPDSGNQPGDLVGATATAHTTGPCKVFWASATTVTVNPCTAYSGGRKVVVASTTLTTTNGTANNFQHVCLTGTNNGPALTTSAGETANLPTFSIGNPVLCLADIDFAAANNTISHIYDTRTFTNSMKEFVITAAAMGLSWIACPTTASQVTTCATTTAGADPVSGVIVASNGSTSTTTPNAIMTVEGPTMAKPILTASTVISGDIVYNSTTANRVTAVVLPTGIAGTGIWSNLGINRSATTSATLCTTTANATNCDNVVYFNMDRR
ncbi:MAG TPA: hypothetical protein VLG37_04970 [Candidatus Saccharimonadales bacterium]|nr:hypothetical protein [Candidatus Saccharimonadales bacterium]